jgi:hypothetical protein
MLNVQPWATATGQVTSGSIELSCSIIPVLYHPDRCGNLFFKESFIYFSADNRFDLQEAARFSRMWCIMHGQARSRMRGCLERLAVRELTILYYILQDFLA